MLNKTIVYLHPHFTLPGGGGKVALETAKKLETKGFHIVLVCGVINKEYINNYPQLNFISINCPLSSSFGFWLFFPFWQMKINKILNQYPNKILFPQVFPANWWAFIYKKFYPQFKCIWYCQEPSAFIHIKTWIEAINNPVKRFIARIGSPLLKLLDIYLLKYCDKIIANSHYSKNIIEQTYHRKVDKVIYPGVDTNLFSSRDGNTKKDYIFTVSRLTKFKNVDQLIKAFSLLGKKFSTKLKIAGDGEELNNLRELTRKLRIADSVVFLGRISDKNLIQYYNEAKIVVFSSINEPFGIVPVEAMGCGTPVIVSRSGGPEETVIEGKTGLFFKPGDYRNLAIMIKYLLENNRYLNYGKFAEKHVRNNYTWDIAVNKILSLISNL